MIIVRYAADAIVGFQHESDARRFLDAMRKRLPEFALSLHLDKTRLIEFGRHAAANRERRGLGKPETFNFLGFTFVCGKSRLATSWSNGSPGATACGRSCKPSSRTCDRGCTSRYPMQGKWLGQVVTGDFNYHAVPTNSRALTAFRFFVTELWQRTLRRRSQKGV